MFDVPITAWPGARRPWFAPERPGPLVHQHLVRTGFGRCRVDRRHDPRIVLAQVSDNYALRGHPDRRHPADWTMSRGSSRRRRVAAGLQAAGPRGDEWLRLIAVLPAASVPTPRGHQVRRIGPAYAPALSGYDPDGAWIDTWGGRAGAGHRGCRARGLVAGRLVSTGAVPPRRRARRHPRGHRAAHRGQGLSTACAARSSPIRRRGLIPTWTTSPDNAASRAVAARLGFVRHREDVLYTVRMPIPTA